MKLTALLSLASLGAAGFVKVGLDDGKDHSSAGASPRSVESRSPNRKGYVKVEFQTETTRTPNLLRARQLDEEDLDQSLTLASQRSLYWLDLEIGTPPQEFRLQLDTGSSNLWVPDSQARQCARDCPGGKFDPSDSSTYELLFSDDFRIAYLDGTGARGDFFTDKVTIGESEIDSGIMAIGLATTLQDGPQLRNDGQGLVGIGYWANQAGLSVTSNTLNDPPTLVQALVNKGDIERESYSIYLNDVNNGTGAIIFGGVDANQYEGELVALQTLPDPDPDALFNYTHFEIALTTVSIEDADGLRPLTTSNWSEPANLDSGTTITYLPPEIYSAVAAGFGATAGIIPCRNRNSNAALIYTFGGEGGPTIRVPLRDLIGLDSLGLYDDRSTEGCSFLVDQTDQPYVLLGNSFMRSGYFVYDLENHVVAIAQVKNNATKDDVTAIPSGTTIPGCTSTNAYVIEGRDATPRAVETVVESVPPTLLPAEPTFALGDLSGGGGGSGNAAGGRLAVGLGWQAVVGVVGLVGVGML